MHILMYFYESNWNFEIASRELDLLIALHFIDEILSDYFRIAFPD